MVHFLKRNFIPVLGITSLLALIFLSILFYRERVYFADAAFQLFLVINDQRIEVMMNRWPSTIFRILPLLGVKSGASIPTVAKLFSISYPLYHAIAFSTVCFFLKDKVIALLIVFTLLIARTETFFFCAADLQQGIICFLVGISFYRQCVHWLPKYLVSIFILTCAAFIHPLTLFPFFYMVIDDLLEKNWKFTFSDFYLPIVFGLAWLVRSTFFKSWYETAKNAEFRGNLEHLDMLNLKVHKVFLTEVPYFYQLVIMLLIVNLFIFFKYKYWLRAIFLLVSIFTFVMIIHIGNPAGIRHFYRESSYITLGVFVSYPFIKHILKTDQIQWKYMLVIPFMILLSFIRIIAFSDDYNDRINWLEDHLALAQCDKSILTLSNKDQDFLKMDWAIPFETALISAEKGQFQTIFNTDKPKDFLKKERRDVFIGPFKILYTSDFNEDYFRFKEGHYCKIVKED